MRKLSHSGRYCTNRFEPGENFVDIFLLITIQVIHHHVLRSRTEGAGSSHPKMRSVLERELGCDVPALNLAGGSSWQGLYKINPVGYFEISQVAATE